MKEREREREKIRINLENKELESVRKMEEN